MFKKLFSGTSAEEVVIGEIAAHIRTLIAASEALHEGIEKNDPEKIASVSDLERERRQYPAQYHFARV